MPRATTTDATGRLWKLFFVLNSFRDNGRISAAEKLSEQIEAPWTVVALVTDKEQSTLEGRSANIEAENTVVCDKTAKTRRTNPPGAPGCRYSASKSRNTRTISFGSSLVFGAKAATRRALRIQLGAIA